MFSATKLISLLILAVSANAQSSVTTSASSSAVPSSLGITPCILACVGPAATANGCAFTDAACVCGSAQFQADAGACLQEHCSAAEVKAALALQQSQCAPLSISPSGPSATPHSVSFTTPPSASATSTAASASGSATKPASSSTKASSSVASAAASTTAKSSASSNQVAFGLSGVLVFAGIALAL
ncbi:uncharacterized protein LACBIDRAFT_294450 [Laccaria bicolor S238N-H82]|uniref:Predicted protein n=1 Tax=Laccaria bicolor (strain S238N-H82 / ATCC MYA-4686) TaxID=486041 RepID=B0DBW0_LACBS|nr:uncharacterized protein LACBIDRAFT_294450 [Laccaria bicolor S238N-H82]EDR07630.1 predicted protein [Laccaria bicolor S238N-H82]|eukprot:XP_001881419.1 predicted protein [Laccaria bicolor S238N-H82]